MYKQELVRAVAENSELTQKQASAAVEAFIGVISDTLASGEKVSLSGFGVFEVKERKERTGVVPRTNERITIPATKAPAFKAGKTLKDKVNG